MDGLPLSSFAAGEDGVYSSKKSYFPVRPVYVHHRPSRFLSEEKLQVRKRRICPFDFAIVPTELRNAAIGVGWILESRSTLRDNQSVGRHLSCFYVGLHVESLQNTDCIMLAFSSRFNALNAAVS